MPRGHPGCIDALELFGPYVRSWITNSKEMLCAACVRWVPGSSKPVRASAERCCRKACAGQQGTAETCCGRTRRKRGPGLTSPPCDLLRSCTALLCPASPAC